MRTPEIHITYRPLANDWQTTMVSTPDDGMEFAYRLVYQIIQSSSLRNYDELVGVPLPEYLSGIVRYGRGVCGS
jgi:hypothetical protein